MGLATIATFGGIDGLVLEGFGVILLCIIMGVVAMREEDRMKTKR